MYVQVTPMRIRGVPLSPRDRSNIQPIRAYVMVTSEQNEELGRAANVAWIHTNSPSERGPLPRLLDATLSGMSQTGFMLTGIEYVDGCAYAQSWWCRD